LQFKVQVNHLAGLYNKTHKGQKQKEST